MRKSLLISAVALLTAFGARAEQLTLSPGARVNAAVSNTNPNYLRVNDDRILSVQAAQRRITATTPRSTRPATTKESCWMKTSARRR
ncbi:hypothetical protein PANPC_00040 (plasmid) [Pantoea sp. Nvir]